MTSQRKRTLHIGWTCCDQCRRVHRNLFTARLHWLWLRAGAFLGKH